MNAKLERKERSHEAILGSAERLLRERGISGARIADVMKGAGLTVGGFYAHFGSKEELVDETLRRTSARLRELLFARIEDKPAPARVEVLLKRYLSAAHRDAETLGCPLPAVAAEVGMTATAHRVVVAEEVAALVDGVEAHLPTDNIVPRRLLALGLVALMFGGLGLARATKGTPLSDEVLRACRLVGMTVSGGIRAAKKGNGS